MRRLLLTLLCLLLPITVSAQARLTSSGGLPLAGGTLTGNLTMGPGTQIFLEDGDATDPAITFTSGTTAGIYKSATNVRLTGEDSDSHITLDRTFDWQRDGTVALRATTSLAIALQLGIGANATNADVFLVRDLAANILAQRNGTNAQTWRLYETFTDTSNNQGYACDAGVTTANVNTCTAFENGTGSDNIGHTLASIGTGDITLNSATGSVILTAPAVTVGSGTGVTVNETAAIQRVTYKVTVIQSQWIDAALTHDLTIATLPAKARIFSIVADITQAFACTATCTSSTLSMVVGKGSGGSEYLDSFDADASTAQFGLVDAERGASLQGIINGETPSWSGTTTVVARLTSGTGNLGDGATTNLSGGDVTFYIDTLVEP